MWKRVLGVLATPALIVLVAFGFRMVFLFSVQASAPIPLNEFTPYGYETGHVAASIAAGKGFSSPLPVESGPTAWFTPVYPYLVAVIFKTLGIYSYASLVTIQTTNCIFSALTCWPILLIGRRLFGAGVGASAAWFWVFLPSASTLPIAWVWETALAALLLTCMVLATLVVAERRSVEAWVWYGLLCALGVLTSPSMVILLPFLAGWAALRAAGGWMPAAKLAALSALAFLLACFPWFVRNYVVFHQVVLFRSNFGLELWLGNNEQVPDSWTPELHPNDNEEERAKYLRMGEIAYMAEKEHQAIEFIRTHPSDFGRFVFHRFMHNWTGLWGPVADAFPAAPLLSEVYLTGKCLFSLLAFLGLIFASRSRIEGATPLAVVILVFPIVYIISHTSSRYRHPIEPIMAVLTVYAVAFLGAAVMRKRVGTLAGRASEVSG